LRASKKDGNSSADSVYYWNNFENYMKHLYAKDTNTGHGGQHG